MVLRLDRTTWDVTVEVVAGTPGSGAPAATSDTTTWEMPLAEVTVPTGASTVTAAQVVNRAWYLGEPLIVCTSTSRPPNAPGRRIRETDTGIEYVSTYNQWQLLYEDTGWVSVTPNTGFAAYGTGIQVRRRNGVVYVTVTCYRSGASVGSSTPLTVATLPAGYRPSIGWTINWVVSKPDHSSDGSVNTTGAVVYNANFATGVDNTGFMFTSTSFPV